MKQVKTALRTGFGRIGSLRLMKYRRGAKSKGYSNLSSYVREILQHKFPEEGLGLGVEGSFEGNEEKSGSNEHFNGDGTGRTRPLGEVQEVRGGERV